MDENFDNTSQTFLLLKEKNVIKISIVRDSIKIKDCCRN